jgi:hypothetical protein
MGQQANSGRNATLDEKKERAAGRQQQHSSQAERIKDAYDENFSKGKTGGAGGQTAKADRITASKTVSVGRSSRPARKR